ncbi:MAG: molybdopterin-dependent oxidoreductase, partial [Treponema sp.]|nr:molybdopterin-dependent oxidoreductase [Treponema sp.]
PIDIRQMNKAGGLQKITLPFVYSFGRSSDAINAVAIRSDFKRKYAVARFAQESHHENMAGSSFAPPFRGVGMACAFDGSAYLGEKFSKSSISMQVSVTEEKKIIVHAYPTSNSIRDVWLQLISDSLGLDKRSISFSNVPSEDTAKTKKNIPLSIPDSLVGTVSIRTLLLKKCVDSIKRKGMDGTAYTVKKSLSAARKKAWNAEEFSGSPFYNTSFGACTLELDFDACTFRENIKKISVVIDGGKILNPKAAESSVVSAIQRCLSMLVENELLQCPVITVNFTQSEEEPKQIGNLVFSMLPAAYTSALSQALAVRVGGLPLKCDSLYKLYEGISYENPYNS